MAYRIDLTARAARDLEHIFLTIDATNSRRARAWFIGLTAAIRALDEHPNRCPVAPEDQRFRHLLYGT